MRLPISLPLHVLSLHLLGSAAACTPVHNSAVQGPGRGWDTTPPTTELTDSRRTASQAHSLDAETAPAVGVHAVQFELAPRATLPASLQQLDDQECVAHLQERRVKFSELSSLRGVATPLEITGTLGGVDFWVFGGGPLEMDCRLAVALEQLEPVFRKHGLTRARFSGAYVYKTTKSGRLSHHAHGLALDLHSFSIGGETLTVEDDYRTGLSCEGDLPPVNALACAMESSGLFDEFLTPDYDADHRDHLHISVARPAQWSGAGKMNASASSEAVKLGRR